MKQSNSGLNTARMVANNGQTFIEGTDAVTGVWFGFQPHNTACTVTALTVSNSNGDTLTGADEELSSLIGTTLDLDSFIGAPNVYDTNAGRITKGYFTSIKLATGACTAYNDTITKD